MGGYLGERLIDRCPKELLLRWVAFGCFTPLFQSHGRFAQEAFAYGRESPGTRVSGRSIRRSAESY